MTKAAWKDVLIRSAKTFVETLIPTLIAALSGVDFTVAHVKGFWIALLIPVLSTALTAAWNIILSAMKTTE